MRGQLKVVNLFRCVISVTCVPCEDGCNTQTLFQSYKPLQGERSVRGQLGSVQSPFQRGGGDDSTVQVEQVDLAIPQGDMFQDVPRVEQVDLSPLACRRLLGGADEIHSHRQFSKFEVQFQQFS